MTNIVYPKKYFKYPLQYNFNPELYGSTVINPNLCDYSVPYKNPFLNDPNINGDLVKCRDEKHYKCSDKPYFGGLPTESFPDGLKYQDLPYFNPKKNNYGMLSLIRPKSNTNNFNMYHGF